MSIFDDYSFWKLKTPKFRPEELREWVEDICSKICCECNELTDLDDQDWINFKIHAEILSNFKNNMQ